MLAISLKLLSMETQFRWDDHGHTTNWVNFWEFRYSGQDGDGVYKISVQVGADRSGEAYAGFTKNEGNWEQASSHESMRVLPAVVTAAMADALRRAAAMKKK